LAVDFEEFSLDPERRELRRGETLVAVEPQVFDLIHYLVRNRDRVVTRDNLIDAIWNGRIV
jgi:DNA-binding winged helix-turn-helix (wHTH) protein